jgi:hypothetical protein
MGAGATLAAEDGCQAVAMRSVEAELYQYQAWNELSSNFTHRWLTWFCAARVKSQSDTALAGGAGPALVKTASFGVTHGMPCWGWDFAPTSYCYRLPRLQLSRGILSRAFLIVCSGHFSRDTELRALFWQLAEELVLAPGHM